MATGVGIDLLEIERMERALERRPRLAERVFTAAELDYAAARARPGRHLAARFAAKEAVVKALGLRGVRVARDRGVAGEPPTVRLSGAPPGGRGAAGRDLPDPLARQRRRRRESPTPPSLTAAVGSGLLAARWRPGCSRSSTPRGCGRSTAGRSRSGDSLAGADGERRDGAGRGGGRRCRRRARCGSSAARATTAAMAWSPPASCARWASRSRSLRGLRRRGCRPTSTPGWPARAPSSTRSSAPASPASRGEPAAGGDRGDQPLRRAGRRLRHRLRRRRLQRRDRGRRGRSAT